VEGSKEPRRTAIEWRAGGQEMTLYAKHSRDELIEEIEEYRALCDQLSSILTRTANALKGEPKPHHRHSWHDLPEVAARMACTSASTGPQKALSTDDIENAVDALRNVREEHIGEWMRESNRPPGEWVLILPDELRPEGVERKIVPTYVRFSKFAFYPLFVSRKVWLHGAQP
jgi:hypothetical protein